MFGLLERWNVICNESRSRAAMKYAYVASCFIATGLTSGGGGAAYVSCGVTISRPSLLFDIIPYFVQPSSLRSSSLALPLYFISISLLPTSVLVSSHHILYYSITLYFRGRKFSRKVNLKYFHEKIFSRIIYWTRENIFPRKYLPANLFRAANK